MKWPDACACGQSVTAANRGWCGVCDRMMCVSCWRTGGHHHKTDWREYRRMMRQRVRALEQWIADEPHRLVR